MFEQSLYEPETIAEPTAEGDLFHNYEITNWNLGPRIYKILGMSAVANVLAILIVGQTSLLTMKGCESPLVSSVCQVLDTIYVGTRLFGTDREYIDAVYDKTELGDAEVTFVDVTGITPPLSYPEGYFQVANPVEFQVLLDAQNNSTGLTTIDDYAGIPTSPPITSGGNLFDTPQTLPKQNPDVIDGQLPTFNNGGTVASKPPRQGRKPRPNRPTIPPGSNKTQDDIDDTTVAQSNGNSNANTTPTIKVEPTPVAEEEAKEDKYGVYINKRPLKVKAKETVEQLVAKPSIKLDAKFSVSLAGTLGLSKDGKTVVLKDPKPVPNIDGTRNDPELEKLVQDWILAVGDAGWFGYIERLDVNKKVKAKKVIVTVQQTDTEFFATIKAEQLDENAAKSLASGLNVILAGAVQLTDGDERLFVKSVSSTFDGKSLVLNVKMPKPLVQEMIQRKLAEEKAPPKQPNSNATGGLRDRLASK